MLVIFSAAPDTASSGSNFNIQFPVEKLGGCNNLVLILLKSEFY